MLSTKICKINTYIVLVKFLNKCLMLVSIVQINLIVDITVCYKLFEVELFLRCTNKFYETYKFNWLFHIECLECLESHKIIL